MLNKNRLTAFGSLSAAAAILLSSLSFAADLPTRKPAPAPIPLPMAFTWTGFYFGGTLGLAHSDQDLTAAIVPGTNINAAAQAAAETLGHISADKYNVTAGLEAGYNQQFGSFVLGAEADIEYIGGRRRQDTGNRLVGAVTIRDVNTAGSDWMGTIRARVGFTPVDRLLIYATGGVAFADMKFNRSQRWSFADGCTVVGGLNSCHNGGGSKSVGWVLGAGGEYAFNDHWSIKDEFLWADFGKVNFTTQNSGAAVANQFITHHARATEQLFRAGLNYKF